MCKGGNCRRRDENVDQSRTLFESCAVDIEHVSVLVRVKTDEPVQKQLRFLCRNGNLQQLVQKE